MLFRGHYAIYCFIIMKPSKSLSDFLSSIPTTTELWTNGRLYWEALGQSPSLKTLRYKPEGADKEEERDLIKYLGDRERKVKAGLEVKGVRMTQIETVTIDFSFHEGGPFRWALEQRIAKVVDSRSYASVLEVEA